ncbi:hypothetical protein [Nocardia sp. NPDC057353]|uniref:hypothetical protein n=1 Tax=Nocardia sp. NPDC057353 TaxID=3346104 RepID=UPI0036449657
MADRLEADPAKLRAAAAATGALRDRINGVLDTLNGAMIARGAPWGNDRMGLQFLNGDAGNGYAAMRDNSVQSGRNAATSFGNFSAGMVQSAEYLEQMDQTHGFR